MTTNNREAAVLAVFAANEAADPEGAWAAYHHTITSAAGSIDFATQICRDLRRRKLLTGQGRGTHATYYLTEKGKAAASAAAA